MNDIKDKQYLALELTKIQCGGSDTSSKEGVYACYEYFLKELTKTLDELSTITELKNEIARLQKENEQLRTNNRDVLNPFISKIITLADGCKGDMEPYVYSAIINNCELSKM
jgi:hypothetical protein